MADQDPALTRALDHLTMQVNPDNVLAAHKVFRDHADDLELYLTATSLEMEVGLCGGDPVSKEAAQSFNTKISQLLAVHWAHQEELSVAADHLRSIARSYGISEDRIAGSLTVGVDPS